MSACIRLLRKGYEVQVICDTASSRTADNKETGLRFLTAQTICSNQVGNQGGYTYELWRDAGGGCMILGPGGTFSMEWHDDNNILGRKGKRPGSLNQIVTYGADYQADGTLFLCIYGWTTNPLIEYYIVDSWGSSRPPGSRGEHKGTIFSDGATYDIYLTQQVNRVLSGMLTRMEQSILLMRCLQPNITWT